LSDNLKDASVEIVGTDQILAQVLNYDHLLVFDRTTKRMEVMQLFWFYNIQESRIEFLVDWQDPSLGQYVIC
jgi:hypothetical protein